MRLLVLSSTLVVAVMVNCRILPGPETPESQYSIRAVQQDEETLFTSEQPLDMEKSHLIPVAEDEMYLVDDMILDEEQWSALRLRKARDDSKRRWPEGSDGNPLVPFRFVDRVDRDAVRAGMKHWESHTCIRFEETTNTNQPHLKFRIKKDENGNDLDGKCSSNVGMYYFINGQFVNIGGNCHSLKIVTHEIGHAMGFYHEQSRSDRDDYITIQWENVEEGRDNVNFVQAVDKNYNIPYDYSSIMHYKAYHFSKELFNKLTIETKDPLALEIIGSGTVLSHRDKLLANEMYNCTVKWLTACGRSSDPCKNDGYLGVSCTCVCPPGTRGSLCETVFEDYYAHLRNPKSEEISSEMSIKVETPIEGYKFVKWIVPPKCKKATLTFKNSNMNKNCKRQFLHVKTDPSDTTGRIMCAEDVKRGVTLMSETKLVITMFNKIDDYGDEKVTLWEADVTFHDSGVTGCIAPSTTPIPTGHNWCSSIFQFDRKWTETWTKKHWVEGKLKITFPKTVSSWNLELTFNQDINDLIIWDMKKVITSERIVTLTPKTYNTEQVAGNILNPDFQFNYFDSETPKLISATLNGDELC